MILVIFATTGRYLHLFNKQGRHLYKGQLLKG